MPKNEYICDCQAVNKKLVEQVRQSMPEDSVLSRLAMFYKIMGDGTRCKILWALAENELCVCDLARLLSMTKSSISHQLRLLREQGTVRCRKDGRAVYYCLDDDHVQSILQTTLIHIRHKQGGCHED